MRYAWPWQPPGPGRHGRTSRLAVSARRNGARIAHAAERGSIRASYVCSEANFFALPRSMARGAAKAQVQGAPHSKETPSYLVWRPMLAASASMAPKKSSCASSLICGCSTHADRQSRAAFDPLAGVSPSRPPASSRARLRRRAISRSYAATTPSTCLTARGRHARGEQMRPGSAKGTR